MDPSMQYGYAPVIPNMQVYPAPAPDVIGAGATLTQPMNLDAPPPSTAPGAPAQGILSPPNFQPYHGKYYDRTNKLLEQLIAQQARGGGRGGGLLGAFLSYASPGGARAAAFMQNNRNEAYNAQVRALELMMKADAYNAPQGAEVLNPGALGPMWKGPGGQLAPIPYTPGQSGIEYKTFQTALGPRTFATDKTSGAVLPDPTGGALSWEELPYATVADVSTKFGSIKQVQDYKEALPLLEGMEEAWGTNTKAADLTIVMGMAKLYDPGSVVRTEEGVNIKRTGNLSDQVKAALSELTTEGRLTKSTRAALRKEAQSLYDARRKAAEVEALRTREYMLPYTKGNDTRTKQVEKATQLPESKLDFSKQPNWSQFEGGIEIPSFRTEQEAESSGFKGEVMINGRRAVIE